MATATVQHIFHPWILILSNLLFYKCCKLNDTTESLPNQMQTNKMSLRFRWWNIKYVEKKTHEMYSYCSWRWLVRFLFNSQLCNFVRRTGRWPPVATGAWPWPTESSRIKLQRWIIEKCVQCGGCLRPTGVTIFLHFVFSLFSNHFRNWWISLCSFTYENTLTRVRALRSFLVLKSMFGHMCFSILEYAQWSQSRCSTDRCAHECRGKKITCK